MGYVSSLPNVSFFQEGIGYISAQLTSTARKQ